MTVKSTQKGTHGGTQSIAEIFGLPVNAQERQADVATIANRFEGMTPKQRLCALNILSACAPEGSMAAALIYTQIAVEADHEASLTPRRNVLSRLRVVSSAAR